MVDETEAFSTKSQFPFLFIHIFKLYICFLILTDTRIVRAHGLLELSKIYKEAANRDKPLKDKSKKSHETKEHEFEEARTRLQDAAMATHMKQHEQDN